MKFAGSQLAQAGPGESHWGCSQDIPLSQGLYLPPPSQKLSSQKSLLNIPFFFFMSHLLLAELKPHLPATQFPSAIWGLPRIPFEVEHRWDGVCCWLENYSFAAQIQHSHGKKLWEFHVNPPLFEDFHSREAPAAQVSHGDAAGGFKDSPPSFQGCWWDPAKPREQSRVCQDFLRQQSPNYLMDTSAHSSSPPR